MAHENFYFNTLDRDKMQGKSLGCIKSRDDTSPSYCTPTLQGATTEGWKSRMQLVSRGLPTPGIVDIKNWMTNHFLLLNSEKTEVLIIDEKPPQVIT